MLCIRGCAVYGLWWHCYLSKSNWDRLERAWTKLLKISLHESCPSSASNEIVYAILGTGNLKSFSNYLVHLRTNKHFLRPTCKRFTLSPTELSDYRNVPTEHPVPARRTRISTIFQTQQNTEKHRKLNLEKRLGTVKAYTLNLADEMKWLTTDFELEKQQLRKKYEINRKVSRNEYNLLKDQLLEFLKSISYQENYQI